MIVQDFDLYYNGELIEFADGESILRREKIAYEAQQTDIYHPVQQGDRLTYIAWKYYSQYSENAPKYWKFIADANNILNPLDISELVGTLLLIPNFQLIKFKDG